MNQAFILVIRAQQDAGVWHEIHLSFESGGLREIQSILICSLSGCMLALAQLRALWEPKALNDGIVVQNVSEEDLSGRKEEIKLKC